MDRFQRKLRLVIATGSAVGFLGGWALLAHAGKPVSNNVISNVSANISANVAAPVAGQVTLPHIDFNALENTGSSSSVQPLTVQPMPQSFFRPRLRTGGS